VTEGHTNPENAARHGVSRRTVQTHVTHALEKLQHASRVELAVRALGEQPPAGAGGSGRAASGA